jgi:hypothetical protein
MRDKEYRKGWKEGRKGRMEGKEGWKGGMLPQSSNLPFPFTLHVSRNMYYILGEHNAQ